MEAAANVAKSGAPNRILQAPIGGQYAILAAWRSSASADIPRQEPEEGFQAPDSNH